MVESARRVRIMQFIILIRPKQWSKNFLVLAALLFSGDFTNGQRILHTFIAFFAMSLVSSATYVFNDLVDIERDRKHPRKKNRPLASGAVSKEAGVSIGVGLLLLGLLLAYSLGWGSIAIVSIYLGMQFLYNWKLKRIPIADVFTIAVGFVLRAVLGGTAISVPISGWLLFCTGALALTLGFAKRRNEFILQGDDRTSSRESLVHYTKASLDAIVIICAACSAIFYGIYTLQSHTAQKFPAIILTSLVVFYGITRYVLLIFTLDEGGEPADIIFKDRHMIATVLLFFVTAILAVKGLNMPFLER
jgi:4-hydroxybenzoate polyprenyltransferase